MMDIVFAFNQVTLTSTAGHLSFQMTLEKYAPKRHQHKKTWN